MSSENNLGAFQSVDLAGTGETKVNVLTKQSLSRQSVNGSEILWFGSMKIDDMPATEQSVEAVYLECKEDLKVFYARLSGTFCLLVVSNDGADVSLVNDHLGIQVVYYGKRDGVLYISESLKLIKDKSQGSFQLSQQAIFNYFYFHCIPSPSTIYEDVFKLEPGKVNRWSGMGDMSSEVIYVPEFAQSIDNTQQKHTECLDVIDKTISQADLKKSGAFLSGGLDSSTVAGMLARYAEPAKTFSIGFDSPQYDETKYAQITAKHFNTEHKVLYLKPEQAEKEFVNVAQYFDEPFGNSSAMAAYFCAKFAKENGIDHLLAGDGGDELFSGNSRYAKQKLFEKFHQAPSAIQSVFRWVFNLPVIRDLPVLKKATSFIRQADIPLPGRLETYNFINQFDAENMFTEEFLSRVDIQLPARLQQQRYSECTSSDSVDKMLYLDWKFTLADNDLVKVNKMCEMADVSVSYPLLEKSVVDFSCEIPANVKMPGYRLRDFFKNACKGFLSDKTLTKSKHGFGLPFGVWIKENEKLRSITLECLENLKARNIIKESLINEALQAHENVHAGYYGELIWIMVIFELWMQGNADNVAA